jgi:outer membrane protein OmpA-like peptidoglycan-associated protein
MLWILVGTAWSATTTVKSGESIQDAIDAAKNGDTIKVEAGTYKESLDLGGKDLDIVGVDGANKTTLKPPEGEMAVVWDSKEAGSLEGFTIKMSQARAFHLENATVDIVDCTIQDAGGSTVLGGTALIDGGSPSFQGVHIDGTTGSHGGAFYVEGGALVEMVDVEIEDFSAGGYGGAIYSAESSLILVSVHIHDGVVVSHGGGIYLDGGDLTATDVIIEAVEGRDSLGIGLFVYDTAQVDWLGGELSGCTHDGSNESTMGGGLFGQGDVTLVLEDVVFEGNSANEGGAIALLENSTLTLIDVTLDGNEAATSGGALYVAGSSEATCLSCVFQDNQGGDGGAVYAAADGAFADTDGEYTGNSGIDGGAIAVDGGEVDIVGADFTGNEAVRSGGALFVRDPARTVEIRESAFSSNSANSADGGAIQVATDGSLTLEDSSFDANEAADDGGAVSFQPQDATHDLVVNDTTFMDNVAGGSGGAVFMDNGGDVALADLAIWRNIAGRNGGGVYAQDTDAVSVSRVWFYGNSAGADGGAWFEEDLVEATQFTNNLVVENSAISGGGVFLSGASLARLVNNTFVGNDATAEGGHLKVEEGSVELINNILAWAVDGGGVHGDSTAATLSDRYNNDAWDNSGGDWTGDFSDVAGSDGNLDVDPDLQDFSEDGNPDNDDYHLALGSACIDAGHHSIVDADGTLSDIGAYGGPEADVVDADGDGWFDSLDCDDSDPSIHPEAAEIAYDAIDQDCDGQDLTDVDVDGYDAIAVGGTDCDDDDSGIYPGALEIWYDGVDQDCAGDSDYDADGDGYDHAGYGGDDCDDTDGAISPDANETWYDGVDQDCDGRSDYDADQDSHDSDDHGGDDCNDFDRSAYPGAYEVPYDGLDQDCDGLDLTDVDGDGWDGAAVNGLDCDDEDPTTYPGAPDDPYDGKDSACDGGNEYDQDHDGYDANAFGGDDCDDTDPLVHPYTDEIWYDGVDQDCDGADDFDADGDGWRSADHDGEDCDDHDIQVHPGAYETWYDGVDQDCLGDDDFDADRDGWDWIEDCDDGRAEAYPGATELYNGLDDDCDGYAETVDRDGDGLIDWYEWQIGTDFLDPDTDGDGVADGQEAGDPEDPRDADLDGILDVFDLDDDGDGIPTEIEARADVDGDGVPDTDVDGDGAPNWLDRDSDGDSYPDSEEGTEDNDFDGIPDYIDFTGVYSGGGCGGGPRWFALFLVVGLTRRRLLAQVRGLGVLLVLLSIAAAPSAAWAGGVDVHGFQLLGATGDPNAYARLAYPDAGLDGDLDVSLVADHAVHPLVEILPDSSQVIVSQLTTSNLAVSWSAWSRARVELVIPVHPIGVAASGAFAGMGDWRFGTVIPVVKASGWVPAVAFAPSIWLPTGAQDKFIGNPGFSAGGVVTVAAEYGRIGWVANVGARVGRQEPERNLRAGSGPLMGLGAHYVMTDALTLNAELTCQGSAGWDQWPLEAMSSARVRLRGGVWATAGLGFGLNDDVGASAFRVVAGVGWSRRAPELEVFAIQEPLIIEVTPAVDPYADRDGDGIVDIEDDCPDQPETFDTFEDEDGCPELDGDQDGVPFERDVCPEEPIYPEQDPRYSDGCPKLAELSGDKIIITEAIYFLEDSIGIQRRSWPVLYAVKDILLEHPELEHVLVEGHTNDNGSAEYNYELSDRRSRAVAQWLVAHGISRNRLLSKGYGYDNPLVDHDVEDALRINRRVEFTVLRSQEEDVDDTVLPRDDELPIE